MGPVNSSPGTNLDKVEEKIIFFFEVKEKSWNFFEEKKLKKVEKCLKFFGETSSQVIPLKPIKKPLRVHVKPSMSLQNPICALETLKVLLKPDGPSEIPMVLKKP